MTLAFSKSLKSVRSAIILPANLPNYGSSTASKIAINNHRKSKRYQLSWDRVNK